MDFSDIAAFSSGICAGVLAIAVAVRGRRTLPHWSFMAGMAALGAESIFGGLAGRAGGLDDPGKWETLQLLAMSFAPGAWLLFSFSYARGNYREFLTRWLIPVVGAVVAPVGVALLFYPDLVTFVSQAAPGAPLMAGLSLPGIILHLLLLLSAVVVLMNLERTYRAAVGTMRWRIKFMVLGVGVLFATRAYSSSQVLLFHAANLSLQTVDSCALLVSCALIIRTLLRAGHFEVNIYPSHSVLHNSFTVMLAGIYLIVVGALAKLVAVLGGDEAFEVKAFLVLVALVALTLLLLSDRVRVYTKQWVSRHFQRPLYDYRRVWQTFRERTTRCIEQASLCEAVSRLVSEVFQALSVSIWLIDEDMPRLAFAASTSLFAEKGEQAKLAAEDATELIRALGAHPKPEDIDSAKGNWAADLRRLQPEQFNDGGHRVCAPLLVGSDVLGVMILGDRVGGTPYSGQDLDLIKAVADQTAVGLLNLRLTDKLSQARQLGAFQAMSAFFVHDLKNTASTLSLMLQNLPVHYQDPAFREDALRGISRTVEHLNDLISRLNMLRHELQVQAVECDLNELVAETLQGQEQTSGVEIVKELAILPRVRLDPTQIKKVLTNLVLNARDASGVGGRIRVETARSNGWAVLAVADTGCGMTPEFIRTRLFRPFQTTKQKGIGIGMFHSKMIVEAHKGRIEVESELGKGTAFRVLLPLGKME
ncbi:MAG TPA: XrtA/PEP-CTERM system histidine kinase PrsK [Candidatus Acidoferrum sp.]|nr:XrtA/PEP-CTERM system histidine kinase PrsK [Candidatus Acidoferrum sp.]